uniref:Serine/threonine-protein phosphatase n=1 Tax=Caenorhabditis tropicalis TaxID=1561998 RepID=A0A1I7UIC3_9PELO
MGDYVDRGTKSIPTLVCICILKSLFPKRFFFLRGNHELASVNAVHENGFYVFNQHNSQMKLCFQEECLATFGEDGKKFWGEANNMFKLMPLAAILHGKIWVAHGGISPLMARGLEYVERTLKKDPQSDEEWQLFVDILWSDPDEGVYLTEDLPKYFSKGRRSPIVYNFTEEGLNLVLKACRLQLIIRGHQSSFKMSNSSDDPYCYSILTAEEDGGPTTVTRGCYARKMVMHHMSKNEDDKFQNNTKWRETKRIAEMPSCSEILKDQERINGTISLCIDFTFDQDPEDGEEVDEPIRMKSRLCCCEGTNKCNEEAMWADYGIPLTELLETIESRKALTGGSAAISLTSAILVFLFAI